MRKSRLVGLVLALMLAGSVSAATANCYSGGQPDWGDVHSIEVTRCIPVLNPADCFYVVIQGTTLSAGLDGYMVAYQFGGRTGRYLLHEQSGEQWARLIAALSTSHFYDLNIPVMRPPPGKIGIVRLDGPEDQVTLSRCTSHFSIGDLRTIDKSSTEWKRFDTLLDHLTASIRSLPWQRTSDKATIRDVEQHLLKF